jgi:hypothetical protein
MQANRLSQFVVSFAPTYSCFCVSHVTRTPVVTHLLHMLYPDYGFYNTQLFFKKEALHEKTQLF